MKKLLIYFAGGIVLALLVTLGTIPGAYEQHRFRISPSLRLQEIEAVKSSIQFFSATISGFYASGGNISYLNIFPAEPAVKHRIFQDIQSWKDAGKYLVMDRDKSDLKNVRFITPVRAIAVVDEDWFNVFQDYTTRRYISGKKANLITVRYFLEKKWGKWVVQDYDVFPQGLPLPPLPAERLLM